MDRQRIYELETMLQRMQPIGYPAQPPYVGLPAAHMPAAIQMAHHPMQDPNLLNQVEETPRAAWSVQRHPAM